MIELTASDGASFSAYRAEPADAPKGAVVVLQDVFGVTPEIRKIAEARDSSQAADAAFTRALSLLDPDLSSGAAEIAAVYAELLTARGDHAAAARHYQAALRYQGRR